MSPQASRLTPRQVSQLILDTSPYLSCDDCFDQIDAAVENLVTGAEPVAESLRCHLVGCAACREEAWSLADLVVRDADLDPVVLLDRLERAIDPNQGQ